MTRSGFADIAPDEVVPIASVDREWREHEGVFLAIVRDPFTDDHHRIVDRFCDRQETETACRHIAKRIEICHQIISEEERVHRSVGNSGETNHLAGHIHAQGTTLIPTECSQIRDPLIGVDKGVVCARLGNIPGAGHLGEVVAVGRASCATQRPKILHLAIAENKGMGRAVRGLRPADDVPLVVDAVRSAGRSAERTEVGEGIAELRLCARDREKEAQGCGEAESGLDVHGRRSA